MNNLSKMKIAQKNAPFSTIKSQGQIQNMEIYARTAKYYTSDETSDKKVMNCRPYFTALQDLQYINNLDIKSHIKVRLISRILNF